LNIDIGTKVTDRQYRSSIFVQGHKAFVEPNCWTLRITKPSYDDPNGSQLYFS
jgi:hypothetical protein